MSVSVSPAAMEGALQDRFGLEEFRPGQREVIEQVLQGRDVLCVMPTGGGKSLCYQLPAVVLPGLTLVVSPLIALMKDQVDGLVQRGVRATLINSTLDPAEQRARMIEIEAGRYEIVYVAPERFRSGRFVEVMARIKPALLAVDEAHCISEWGHDFRPDYARIGLARKRLGSPPCIALTATATDVVRRDIADQLDFRDPAVFVTGFDRPNFTYAAFQSRRELDKLATLVKTLEECPGSAIVYASSRARCESVAEHLRRELKREAVIYHAGLSREERQDAQERFMGGKAEIVVATNAFGMGVDKANIRAVVHYNMPGTLEAYYQEAGRAGRDGMPAKCVLMFAPGDRILQEMFIDNEYPPHDVVYKVYNFLRTLDADPIELTQQEIKSEIGIELGESAVGTALRILETAGAVERFQPRENMAIVRINVEGDDPRSLADRLGPQAHVQKIVLAGLEGLVNRRYAETIYFQPGELAKTLGLDRPALTRAIRVLATELPIDYVPPFRGNAVRVLDRARKARDIEIDFEALEKRKQREYDKLERMVKYAQTTDCRRGFLLGYFGDAHVNGVHCGRCDNCGDTAGAGVAAIDTVEGREVILKVLSGVARAKGRFGKTLVAQMLKGSASEKMERGGLKSLSTFGILPMFTQQELSLILEALTTAGYVESPEVDRFRPIVNLSERGWGFLKNRPEGPVPLAISEELAAKIQVGGLERCLPKPAAREQEMEGSESTTSQDVDPLHERLKALRTEWAREAKQPAYCVFTNHTLEELVRKRPGTPQALAEVKGLGASRVERYGAALLKAVADCNEPEVEPEPPLFQMVKAERNIAPVAKKLVSAQAVVTEEWSWRLLERGFTPEEAAEIRGIDLTTVIRHATLAVRAGKAVDLAAFVDAETLNCWRNRPIESGEPVVTDEARELWSLFLACRRGR